MQHQLLLMLMHLNVTGKGMIHNFLVIMKLKKVVVILHINLSYILHRLILFLEVVVDFFSRIQHVILKIQHYLIRVQIISHLLMNIGVDISFGIKLK